MTHKTISISQCLVLIFLAAGIFCIAGCEHLFVEPPAPAIIPGIQAVRIYDNPNNVLSAIVTARTSDAAAAAVEFGSDSLFRQSTPFIQTYEDSIRIPVLGLEPEKNYLMRTVAVSSSGQKSYSQLFSFQTKSLPNDIPEISVIANNSPASGFVMMGFASSRGGSQNFYAIIIDNEGAVVWYRSFKSPFVDFQKQVGGNYTVFSSADGSPPHFYEMNNLGEVLREFRASNGLETGPHEIKLLPDRYCLFGIEFRQMNLTSIGGISNASVRSTVVEYHRQNRQPLRWSPADYLQVTDAASDVSLTSPTVNPWHGNAIDIDADDNLLVSFRNSDEIIKIDSRTGTIIWRLGGKNNQFTFINDRFNGFSHQHGIRRLSNGNIILFDNGNLHNPQASRAVEYRLNEAAKTAELVWEYLNEPPLYSFALGFAQRLSNGNTLICYGAAQRVIEVDMSGAKQWELALANSTDFVYRAFKIDSLY